MCLLAWPQAPSDSRVPFGSGMVRGKERRQAAQERVLDWGEVAELRDAGRLPFVVDSKVYCLDGSFEHPGGAEVLAEFAGTDATEVFHGRDPRGHAHTAVSVALLDQFRVGRLADGGAATPSPPPQQQAFPIDESRPLLWQIPGMGARYWDWVAVPSPAAPRFFGAAWAEAATKTPWWVVPLLWLPLAAACIVYASKHLSPAGLAALVAAGGVAWQALEYSLHRFLFHAHPTFPAGIFAHFLFHGCHHKYPNDVERLVFPPLPASWVVAAVWAGVRAAAPSGAAAAAVFGGIMLGYVAYDCAHYGIHSGAVGGFLRESHMRHHYVDERRGYGISSPLFDFALGTLSLKGKAKVG